MRVGFLSDRLTRVLVRGPVGLGRVTALGHVLTVRRGLLGRGDVLVLAPGEPVGGGAERGGDARL